MATIHGPAGGYDFGNKRQYRRALWIEIDRRLAGIPRRARRVVILETQQGEEARFLLARGYRPELIHAVAENPAVVATMTRGLRADFLPDVTTHGAELLDALEAIQREHVVHAVNLDFTSNANLRHAAWARAFRDRCLREGMVVAQTILRGREAVKEFQALRNGNVITGYPAAIAGDAARLLIFATVLGGEHTERATYCRWHLVEPYGGRYKSANTQSMLWWVATVRSHREAVRDGDHVARLVEPWIPRRAAEPNAFQPLCVIAFQNGMLSREAYRRFALDTRPEDPPGVELRHEPGPLPVLAALRQAVPTCVPVEQQPAVLAVLEDLEAGNVEQVIARVKQLEAAVLRLSRE
jgi:hypothetical protein